MIYIDSHAHIDGPEFDEDRDEVVGRAHDAGVGCILNVGTGDPSSGSLERAVDVAARYENVFASVGIHPHDAKLFDSSVEVRLRELISGSERVIALGEIGLDYHYDHSPREVQREVFRKQLQIARSLNVPAIIHSREADAETVEILSEEWSGSRRKGIMHCFGGSVEMASQVLDLNFLVSFAGNITFKKAEALREAARFIPLDRLLIETDCPFLTPVPYRGKRNEPARVIEVARCLATIHKLDDEEIGRQTTLNFLDAFNLNLT